MGLSSIIARRSLTQRPGRTAFSLLGVALGVATVVGVVTLAHATIEGYARPRQVKNRADIELSSAGGVVSSSDALRDLEGISAAAEFFQNDALLETVRAEAVGDTVGVKILAIEAEQAAAFGLYGLAAGGDLNPRASEREVIIGPRVAIEHGVEVGDEVLLSRPHRPVTKRCEDGVLVSVRDSAPDQPRSERFRVVGVLNREGVGRTGAGNVVVVDFDVGRDLYRGVPIQPRFWAAKDPSVDLERLRRSLAAAYSYSLNQGIVVGQAADERAFRTGVRMLGLLALVLGLYVIFHTLSMSLTERVQEVGTLHALGATRRQIGRVFFTEAVVLADLAVLGLLVARLTPFSALAPALAARSWRPTSSASRISSASPWALTAFRACARAK